MKNLSPFEKAVCTLSCACLLAMVIYFFTTQVPFCPICRADPAPGTYLWDTCAGTLLPLPSSTGTVRFPARYNTVRYCGTHRPAGQEGRFLVLNVHPTMLISYPIREAGIQTNEHTLTKRFLEPENCWEITIAQ